MKIYRLGTSEKIYTKIERDIFEDVNKKLEESGMNFSGVIKCLISESDYDEMCEFYDGKISKVKSEMERRRIEKTGLLYCIDEIGSKYKNSFKIKSDTSGT